MGAFTLFPVVPLFWCNSFLDYRLVSAATVRATRVLCATVPSPWLYSCTLDCVVRCCALRTLPNTNIYYTLPHRAAGPAAADSTRTECCGIGRECRPRHPTVCCKCSTTMVGCLNYWSVAALCFTGREGYLHYGLALQRARLSVANASLRCTSCTDVH